MKLNYDCLRDVLITLETHLEIEENLRFHLMKLDQIIAFDELSGYSKQDIYYCVYNLIEIDYITGNIRFADGGVPHFCAVNNITYHGHEFLQSIKSDTVWNEIKAKIKPVATLSIPIISEVAKKLILSRIGIE